MSLPDVHPVSLRPEIAIAPVAWLVPRRPDPAPASVARPAAPRAFAAYASEPVDRLVAGLKTEIAALELVRAEVTARAERAERLAAVTALPAELLERGAGFAQRVVTDVLAAAEREADRIRSEWGPLGEAGDSPEKSSIVGGEFTSET